MKRFLSLLLALSMLFCLASCGTKKPEGITLKAEDIKDVVKIEMSVADYGKMTLELYHDKAPATVENFVSLTCDGFYDGTVFHRIVSGFMIQGGDNDGDGIGGSEKTITGEFFSNGFFNDLKHERGVISMARTNDPNSASSQFFIMHEANEGLDGNYAAFGKVIDGLDVVDKIAAVETTYNAYGTEKSVPTKEVKLEYVVILETYDREGPDAAEDTSADAPKSDPVKVEMKVKKFGTITLELYPDTAPKTVDNFVNLAKSGFYNGTVFHRIVSGFMIQGGAGEEDKVKTIDGEFYTNGFKNDLKHERGVISMARTDDPNSASSQFFICHEAAPHLDGNYAAFGKVIDGLDTVDKIAAVEVFDNGAGEKSEPGEEVVIESVTVIE